MSEKSYICLNTPNWQYEFESMKILISLLFLTLLSFTHPKIEHQGEYQRWQEQAKRVEIIRDDYGIPHIYGKTDADAVFGLLYAQCEDDFNRLEQNYIWAIGRLAELKGEKALYSDLRARLYMTREEAMENFKNSPEWLQKLCVAFADGINYYLATHPEVKPRLLNRFEPWMPYYFSEGSIGGDIERVSTKKIGEFYGHEQKTVLNGAYDGSLRLNYNDTPGSNGIVVSGKLTHSGNAMLLINPHTSFFFRGEVHVVSEEGLNAYGAVTWGQFFVYQGFNEHTGWMHTSTGTDIIDEFKETIDRDSTGIFYRYGDEKRAISTYQVHLKFKTDKGMQERTIEAYRTHHGPITHAIDGKWISTSLMWKPVKALEQSFLRTKQTDHYTFRKMMDMRTNSSNNTVFADSDGNIAYYHGNFIPRRNTNFNYKNPVDGSNPDTDWKGLHEVDENILIVNPENGWIQNCNSTPFTAAGEFSPKPENFPKYMTSFPENYRGIHATSLLEKAGDLTLDKLINLAYDPYLPGAEDLIAGLLSAAKSIEPDKGSVKEALKVLANWDYRVDVNSIAMTLTQYYYNNYYRAGASPFGRRNFIQMISYMSKQSAPRERMDIFEKAVQQLIDDFGTWKTPWGEYNRYQRINGAIVQQFNDSLESVAIGMASGYWGALASFGTRHGKNTKRIYGVGGNSFVAVVEFGDRIHARSLLAGGQSGDPASVHFDDQVSLYAKGEFKNVAFYREDVLARSECIYHPGQPYKKE